MSLRRFITATVFGITVPQEYVCVGLEDFDQPLSAYVTGSERSIHFVIDHQILLGYKPLIIGLSYDRSSDQAQWLHNQQKICVSLVMGSFQADLTWTGFTSDKEAVARLILRKIISRNLGESVIFIFEGQYGKHRFLSPFHQATNRLKDQIRRSRDELWLPGNLYDQVRIGYATPRTVAMVTVRDPMGRVNMFPTDLHGPVGSGYYVGSLRHGGKATLQVEQLKTIAVSEVKAQWCREAYSFGKNHMKDPGDGDDFPLSPNPSRGNDIPLPESVVRYRELRTIDFIDLGIHRIHFYKTLHEVRIHEGPSLAHIHSFYAQWRNDRGLSTDYLYR